MDSVRVVTYNVLSDCLCQPHYFVSCNEVDLDANTRFTRITSKLLVEMAKRSILCLQEVTMNWEAQLHPFFSENGYYFVTALYGGSYNGFMGVGMAWPTEKYELVSTNICRLGDTKKWFNPLFVQEEPTKFSIFRKKMARFLPNSLKSMLNLNLSQWEIAKNRQNRIITTHLKLLATDETFFVATYHMPCTFREPQILVIHSALALSHLQNLAEHRPYILAGDFNLTPNSVVYNFFVTGFISPTDPAYPQLPWYDSWKPILPLGPVRSAYAAFQGSEPSFTNYAQVRYSKEFIGTLDYIFISEHWSVRDVLSLPTSKKQIGGPLPNPTEPSDHLMIAATLSLEQ